MFTNDCWYFGTFISNLLIEFYHVDVNKTRKYVDKHVYLIFVSENNHL